jgi:thiamine biosynthesis protein ThiS
MRQIDFGATPVGSMLIQLNGEPYEGSEAMTVSELLDNLGLRQPLVAVELNLDILPKAQYGATRLKAGDEVEVVHFVGGGKSQRLAGTSGRIENGR